MEIENQLNFTHLHINVTTYSTLKLHTSTLMLLKLHQCYDYPYIPYFVTRNYQNTFHVTLQNDITTLHLLFSSSPPEQPGAPNWQLPLKSKSATWTSGPGHTNNIATAITLPSTILIRHSPLQSYTWNNSIPSFEFSGTFILVFYH